MILEINCMFSVTFRVTFVHGIISHKTLLELFIIKTCLIPITIFCVDFLLWYYLESEYQNFTIHICIFIDMS